MKKSLVKIIATSVALGTSAIIGDYLDISEKFNQFRYNETFVEKGFYKQPFNLHKEYKINEKGNLEVYFGNEKLFPVTEELRVNERKTITKLKADTKGVLKKGGRFVGEVFDSVRDFAYSFYGGVISDE